MLYSTNPLDRLNKQVGRGADNVGLFPNEDIIMPLIGEALLHVIDQ